MKNKLFPGATKTLLSLLCLVNLFLFYSASNAQGDGSVPVPGLQSYCNQPPFPAAGIKSNLLLMIDNSASMYDLAYSNPSTYCLDDSYQNGNTYSGYFDQNSIYQYDFTTKRFVSCAVLPTPPCSSGSCAASTEYLYLEMTAAVPPEVNRTVRAFKASGRFLNWLAMSKLDIEKQVLTGGKFFKDPEPSPDPNPDSDDITTGKLQGETRGCQGKRFVKIAPGAAQITFAVRGPVFGEAGYRYSSSGGGATTIEIYDKAYRKQACLEAVDAWVEKKGKAALIAKADACMDVKEEPVQLPRLGTMPSTGAIFNRIMAICYGFLEENAPIAVDTALRDACIERYVGDSDILNSNPLNWSSFEGICANGLRHTPVTISPGVIDSSGYLGKCYSNLSETMTDACFTRETTHYCNEIVKSVVTDPSKNVAMTAAAANVPAFLIDAGVSNLGTAAGAFQVRVHVESLPAGLIQQFSDRINFGAMVFNATGATGAECGPGKLQCVKQCRLNPSIECTKAADCTNNTGPCQSIDGGRIISYLNDPASAPGNHATGLIAALDGIMATGWTPFAETFYNAMGYLANRTDIRIQPTDFDTAQKPAPSQYSCQKNNVLIVSDGMSTADSNTDVEALAKLYGDPRNASTGKDDTNNCPGSEGSRSLDDLAWIASHRNIKQFSKAIASTDLPLTRDQYITTHVIFTGASNGAPGECDPATLMRRTAESGRGIYAGASDPGDLAGQLLAVLLQVAEGTNSGTDSSILASGNDNGAIFLQESYYPKKSFDSETSASWIGEMQSLWYYIDPFLGNTGGGGSTVREDTVADLMLNMENDRVVALQGDTASLFYDANGDGKADGATEVVDPDAVKALWRAGKQLWSRDLAVSPRTIYTPSISGGTQVSGTGLMKFSSNAPDNSAVLQPYLQALDQPGAVKIIKYVQGYDFPGDPTMRSRTVQIGSIPDATVSRDPDDPYVTNPRDKGIGVWKLGDIISSTPKVQSAVSLNSYHLAPPKGYSDSSYSSFVGSKEYQNRGTVYVGANDGMLHAFSLGKLKSGSSAKIKASLEPFPEVVPGTEVWSFIPRNALPYLTYLKDTAYQHLYYVDGSITVADVSIGVTEPSMGESNSAACVPATYWDCPKSKGVVKPDNTLDPAKNTWRTIVIGGMGLGGASWDSCAPRVADPKAPSPLDGTPPDCVPTPIADPSNPSNRLGYSSYFALDVTDSNHPSLLWEFSNPDLGYAATGPAIVRVGEPDDRKDFFGTDFNGRWFAVFGSGPTGAIEKGQFLGRSDRELKFFVVDLRTGALITTISTGIKNAFAGSMNGGAIDADRWDAKAGSRYRDDAIYTGYVAMDPELKTWTRGGVGRIMIGEIEPKGAQLTDDNVKGIWNWSRVIGYHPEDAPDDLTGPVSTGIARLQDKKSMNLWLYFGTGRYYYRSLVQDDWAGARAIYGIKEPCYLNQGAKNSLDSKCAAPVCTGAATSADCIVNQTDKISAVPKGWRIDLDAAEGTLGAERVITNPVSMTGGAVFFTTFQPSSTPCQTGNSYLWGVRYDNGGEIPGGSVQGKVLVQLSAGNLKETGTGGLTGKDKRRGPAMPGMPGGLKVISNSGLKPLKKIIHIQER